MLLTHLGPGATAPAALIAIPLSVWKIEKRRSAGEKGKGVRSIHLRRVRKMRDRKEFKGGCEKVMTLSETEERAGAVSWEVKNRKMPKLPPAGDLILPVKESKVAHC